MSNKPLTLERIAKLMPEKKPLRIMQTKFGKDNGNCLTACVACLTGIPIEKLPDLYSHSGIEWWDTLYSWCKDNGYGVIYFEEKQPMKVLLLGTFGIGAFTIEGSEELHAVILEYKLQMNGEEWIWEASVYHDPNPIKPKLVDLKFHIFLQPNHPISDCTTAIVKAIDDGKMCWMPEREELTLAIFNAKFNAKRVLEGYPEEVYSKNCTCFMCAGSRDMADAILKYLKEAK